MYLKNIKLQGFKSFADKIDLEFGQGITAIVGPNGSGKSNVSDAIRWVLGEQSAKSLRGSKMEDVIFAGTQKRNPLGFAQVSITLDNSDGIFNNESKELTVTRRVARSGESDYYINNSPCRLKDVHEMFMDTGLGREGYSVIGQGKIDQILSSRAEERRHIFEEASGITKYKYRKNESEKKLLQTDENLIRIKDILVSLEERVEPLRIQSEKARRFLDLRETLKGLDINIAIRNIDKQRDNLKEGQKKFNDAYNQLNDEKMRLDIISEQISAKTDLLSEVNEEINKLKEQSFALEKENETIKGRIEIIKNDIKNNSDNALRWQSDAAVLNEKIEICDKSIAAGERKIEETQAETAALKDKIALSDADEQRLAQELDEKNAQIEKYKNDIVSYLEDISVIKAKLSGFNELIKNFDDRKAALGDELKEKKEAQEKNTALLKTIEEHIKENEAKKESCNKEMLALKDEYFAVSKELSDAKEIQNTKVSMLNDKSSRVHLLKDLEKGLDGYSKGVKNVLSANINGVHGLVSKLIEIDDKYVTAVEIALGNMVQNIVVADENCAKVCIAHLSRIKGGRATFLPLSSVKGELINNPPLNDKGYVGIASELIICDEKYKDVFKSLLGRVIVVDNIDNAVNIAKKNKYRFKIVTLDGQLINAGGAITGGSFNKNQSLLSRSKEIEKLEKEISDLQKTVDKNDSTIAKLKQRINGMADKKQELETSLAQCSHTAVKYESERNNINRILRELEHSVNVITTENGKLVKNISDIEGQTTAYKEKILESERMIKEARAHAETMQGEYDILFEKKEEIGKKILDAKISFSTGEKDIEAARSDIYSLSANKNALKMELAAKHNDITNIQEHNDKLKNEITELEEQIQSHCDVMQKLTEQVMETQSGYEQDTEKLKNIQKSLKEQNETIYLLQHETARLEAKNSKFEADCEAMINKLWDEYELTYNTALEYKKSDFDMNDGQKQANSLRSQIKALGNINVDAIEEYKEVKEKFDFLSAQKNDLDVTKKKLEDIIEEMQHIMVEQFEKSFEIIQNKFNSVFHELFGGGMGRLTLTEPDNVLESGIEIEVQPPGKKLQNMMALSGGEKALSAIALLFSVLEVRPTPFCILDEVEAALDDNNVYRFADYVKNYSEKTQFIVVTHRRGTMEAADIMYGITMQEKGVSKLLKLKFEDLEDYK